MKKPENSFDFGKWEYVQAGAKYTTTTDIDVYDVQNIITGAQVGQSADKGRIINGTDVFFDRTSNSTNFVWFYKAPVNGVTTYFRIPTSVANKYLSNL